MLVDGSIVKIRGVVLLAHEIWIVGALDILASRDEYCSSRENLPRFYHRLLHPVILHPLRCFSQEIQNCCLPRGTVRLNSQSYVDGNTAMANMPSISSPDHILKSIPMTS